ncbi:MAG: hypothetical protein ACXWXS_04550 [Actinomycetota bacterium]
MLGMHGVRDLGSRVELTAEQVRAFLASPAGQRFRRVFAAGVIIAAPLIFRSPFFRRYPLFRVLETIGGVALLIKTAEAIRDWDGSGQRSDRIVIDVPPAA